MLSKDSKLAMLGWIQETFNVSKDVFEFHPYNVKHWMEKEIGVYASEEEFRGALDESGFEVDDEGYFFHETIT